MSGSPWIRRRARRSALAWTLAGLSRACAVFAVSLSACAADGGTSVPIPAEASSTTDGTAFDAPDGARAEATPVETRDANPPPDVETDAPIWRDSQAGDAAYAILRRPTFVVVLGSSTASGHGLTDPATSWVERYRAYLSADLPGSKLTNLAVSGYSTFQVQPTGTMNPNGRPAVDPAHNVTAALALHPDAVIVNLPSNDAAMGVPVDESLNNLKVLAANARQANVAIWITTTQPRQLDAKGIALILGLRDRIEQEFGSRALDFFTPLAAPNGTPLAVYNQGDGVHPNAEGHRLLFEQVRLADLPAALAKSGGNDASRD